MYNEFFEHVILYSETQIPKDLQDPLQLLNRLTNELNRNKQHWIFCYDNIYNVQ